MYAFCMAVVQYRRVFRDSGDGALRGGHGPDCLYGLAVLVRLIEERAPVDHSLIVGESSLVIRGWRW